MSIKRMHITFVRLGPDVRPSSAGFLNRGPDTVWVGPPLQSHAGSGEVDAEMDAFEQSSGRMRYMHILDGNVEAAITDFAWVAGADYVFGLHMKLYDEAAVMVISGKILVHLRNQLGLTVTSTKMVTDTLLTCYSQLFASTDPDEVAHEQRRRAASETTQQVYIGEQSAWHRLARETTARMTDITECARLQMPDVSEPAMLDILEHLIACDGSARNVWAMHYRAAILQDADTRKLLVLDGVPGHGVTFWQGMTPAMRNNCVRNTAGTTTYEVRPRMPATGDKSNGNLIVALSDCIWEDPVPDNAKYVQHPQLMRVEAILRCLTTTDVADVELRMCPTTGPPENDGYPDGYVVIPKVCNSHRRIVKAVTYDELLQLNDPLVRPYFLERRGWTHIPDCCITMMANPIMRYCATIFPEDQIINPWLNNDPGGSAPIVSSHQRFPRHTPFLPIEKLVWDSVNGTATHYEVRESSHYLVRRSIMKLYPRNYRPTMSRDDLVPQNLLRAAKRVIRPTATIHSFE